MYRLFCVFLCSIHMASATGLYNANEHLYILDNTNFHNSLLYSDTAWVIEFYNSWCGHCIQFAPTWKEFAADIKGWNHTVKIGVIDCANDANIDICREYEIMGYPTIRLFTSNVGKGNVGEDLKTRELTDMKHSIIDFIVSKQQSGNSSKSWVNLLNYNEPVDQLLKSVDKEHGVLIMEKPTSYLGREVILDIGKDSKIYLRRDEIDRHDKKIFTSVRAVAFVKKNGEVSFKSVKSSSRKGLRNFITQQFTVEQRLEMGGNLEIPGDGRPEISKTKGAFKTTSTELSFSSTHDQVYMVDIENTLSYALQHEVSMHKEITGESLSALKNFITAVLEYLPLRLELQNFIENISNYLSTQTFVRGEIFSDKLKILNISDSILPGHQNWIGCLGSNPSFRGYPCGLWTTFHTMTVNSHDAPTGVTVLQSIHGYVKHFFGCSHCSKHFQEMYVKNKGDLVKKRNDFIGWLWKAHNEVNERLKGDLTDDPAHPKQQYPPKSMCPKCWSSQDTFVDSAILDYLKILYSKYNISYKGTISLMKDAHNRQAKVYNALNSKNRGQFGEDFHLRDLSNTYSKPNNSLNNSWGFNRTDINMCVVLYGLSTVLVVVGYIVIMLRRRRRKQKFMQQHKKVEQLEANLYPEENGV